MGKSDVKYVIIEKARTPGAKDVSPRKKKGFFGGEPLKRVHQKRSAYGKAKHKKSGLTLEGVESALAYYKEQKFPAENIERLEKIRTKLLSKSEFEKGAMGKEERKRAGKRRSKELKAEKKEDIKVYGESLD